MGILKRKPVDKTVMASAPEEQESNEEIKHINDLSEGEKTNYSSNDSKKYIEVPVFLSQDRINNMIIENNIMLKEILAMANEK